MRKILRFRDLNDRNVVHSWPQLKRLVELQNFPVGFMLGANSRAWYEDEIEAWLETRPLASDAKPPLKGGAAQRAAAKAERETEAA